MLDRTFKALADPTRRRILALLRPADLAAGEIASQFEMAWASVSHHLQVLREAGLVVSRRDGQRLIYSLNTTAVQDALQHLFEIGGMDRPEDPRG
ncbi:MAG TPA: autorepressor SdpR family transcription factor [Gemmatimonadales bacterium]|nr:autorepressor SdpR family transcription factor [Gemmatimonadales bacterium]